MLRCLFIQEFQEEATLWEDRLTKLNTVLDAWVDVQRKWVYLEGIFLTSRDIKQQLPTEAGVRCPSSSSLSLNASLRYHVFLRVTVKLETMRGSESVGVVDGWLKSNHSFPLKTNAFGASCWWFYMVLPKQSVVPVAPHRHNTG